MGLFKKSPNKLAGGKARNRDAERQLQAKEFARTPAGQASAGIFQIAFPLSKTTAIVVLMTGVYTKGKSIKTHTTVLYLIEAQGWRLDHANYVFRITGSEHLNKLFAIKYEEMAL